MAFDVYPTVADEVVRYLEDGTFNEALGAGPTLSVSAGTERWVDIVPGVRGFAFDEATKLITSAYDAALDVDDAVTVECIFRSFENTVTSDTWSFFQYGATGEGASTNNLYALHLWDPDLDRVSVPMFDWEYSSPGGNETAVSARDFVIEPGGVYHIVGVREAKSGGVHTARLYVNAQLAATEIGLPQITWTVNTSRRLHIGANVNTASGDSSSRISGALGFIRICSRALTDEEIEAAYAATLGGVFGARLAPTP